MHEGVDEGAAVVGGGGGGQLGELGPFQLA